MYKNDKSKPSIAFERLILLLDESPSLSALRLLKIYAAFFEAERNIFTVIKALKFFKAEKDIPLETIKSLADQLDRIIGTLGIITLQTGIKLDEEAVITEIAGKLGLNEPHKIDYLEWRIRKLTSSIIASCKDKHFQCCLDYLKAKTWRLLEALDEYSQAKYKKSIF